MALVFRGLHPAASPQLLNEEWILLENTGPGPLSSTGWSLLVGRQGQRPRSLGTLDPGFVMQPGERFRLITGTPSKKAQGTPPPEAEGLRNYCLFLREAILQRPGLVVRIALKQAELATATFAPEREDGLQAG